MKVSFILNSSKRRARDILREIHNFHTAMDVEVLETQYPGHARELSYEAAQRGRVVVATGGDGTVNECVNGLMCGDMRQMAILPMGTGNDFVRSFPQATTVEEVMKALGRQQFTPVDVIRIQSSEGVDYGINIADAGMGALAVENLFRAPKWLGARFKYTWAIIKTLVVAKNDYIKCASSEWNWEGKAKLIAAANGRFFGTGLAIAPDANVTNGLLNVTIIGDISLLTYLRKAPFLRAGKPINHPEVHYRMAQWIELQGDSKLEKDGELSFTLPARIESIPGAISMLEVVN